MLKMTRSQARGLQSEYPVGEAYGGLAYGAKQDPVTAGVAIGGASIIGGKLQADAAGRAARRAEGTANAQMQMQRELAAAEAARNQPLVDLRNRMIPQMEGYQDVNMADWQQDPRYQASLGAAEEERNRLLGSGWARGMGRSGATLRDLMTFGQSNSNKLYGQVLDDRTALNTRGFGRLSTLAGMGQGGVDANSRTNTTLGNNLSNLAMQNAATQGAAGLAQANAWGGAIQSGVNAFGNYYAQQNSPWASQYGPGSAPMPGAASPYRSSLGVAASQYGYD
jgi:hypothetical protein